MFGKNYYGSLVNITKGLVKITFESLVKITKKKKIIFKMWKKTFFLISYFMGIKLRILTLYGHIAKYIHRIVYIIL